MRIISGKYRGMKLSEFQGRDIRPTADRVKESLFNILYEKIAGARVLDLFCGSGNLGIECLSRGADFVHFNDISPESVRVLEKNLARLKEERYCISTLDFGVCLSRVVNYDLIFIDPPYKSDCGIRALRLIAQKQILNTGGIAVFESDKPFTDEVEGLKLSDERKYGITYLTFFERTI